MILFFFCFILEIMLVAPAFPCHPDLSHSGRAGGELRAILFYQIILFRDKGMKGALKRFKWRSLTFT